METMKYIDYTRINKYRFRDTKICALWVRQSIFPKMSGIEGDML